MEIRQFSPRGDILAVVGRRGYIHLLDWTTSGGEQIVASLKSNSPVNALCWTPSGEQLLALGQNAEVLVWDIRSRRCLSKWTDEGGFGSRRMVANETGSHLTIG